MALSGEIDKVESCPDCGVDMPVGVQRSAAGYYLGQFCGCGPYNRLTGYFATREVAELELASWTAGDRTTARDTDYHGG